ncbi:MAG: CAP domain-containing protein [Patescibacteria group bacterium]|nr:CAP domain-containing protein [Patescibacteria group bacterium]
MPKTALMASITPDKIISLTNKERDRAGLDSLDLNDQLTKAAVNKAQAVLDSQTFDHAINGKKFSSWIRETGYQYSLVGENLAMDFITAEGLLRAWIASPEHRANILNDKYGEIGVGIAEGKFAGQDTIIVAEIFGAPLVKPAPIPKSISRLNERIMPWESGSKNYLSIYHSFLGNLSRLAASHANLF